MEATDEVAEMYISGPKVRKRYGISEMTLWRWLHESQSGFPQPIYLGRFRHWKLSALVEWERECARKGRVA
ncbi:DNA-binding protein [Mesorhizobium sp.]|uniref:helix-turn-helix transcriptional regulator n=1 Tax=Mesorhizobium sp. TaxID=1871066 RepID=UPI000FE7E6D9|nr:DNA-binding protein [Mesorhizobium sp.]RWM57445.1 MAG: DNA-binding protein [Mesorhizobium sp.]RWM59075.1 MAG: DNA-binding protein [Mesorhizobium sp.]RWM99882.1 MAG: DNA-binding protein [Mesorhizobium sp.]TIO70363.1 MAG: DNA-binding protein [Mesorhizobium sp.]TIR01526.1 MAG: DNA-binding protein [Mesorhizobium sp.]